MTQLLKIVGFLSYLFIMHMYNLMECLYIHYFANKGPSSQGYGFSSGHVWMRELGCEER